MAFRGNQYGTFCGTFFGSPIAFDAVGAINVDGTGETYLTCVRQGSGSGSSLDWSPDGTLIAYGRSGLADPVIAFIDPSGQAAGGLTAAQLGDINACDLSAPQCIHFSPDSARLAYVNAANTIRTINLDGTGQMATAVAFGGGISGSSPPGIWWTPGTIPAPAQLTLAPDPVEVWPGYSQQLTPSVLDATNDVILHTAASYDVFRSSLPRCGIEIGPYGLVMFSSGDGNDGGSIRAANGGLTSDVSYKCWASAPCTYALDSSGENVAASGGSGSVGVTADPGTNDSTCPWNVTSHASWIVITSGSGGSGNGRVSFTVAANIGAARQGTMTIAGLTYSVSQASLQSITVSPATASIAAGATQPFTAVGHDSDGGTEDLTTSVTWSSSNPSVATISNGAGTQGLATGIAAGGPVTITATRGGIDGTAQLTVTAPVQVQTITVAPPTPPSPKGPRSSSWRQVTILTARRRT